MKPEMLEAGLPLALSVAAFLFFKIRERRNSIDRALSLESQADSPETSSREESRDAESVGSHNSTCILLEGGEMITSMPLAQSPELGHQPDYEEEVLSLRRQIEHLQGREWELAMRFLLYCDLKEQESRLLELKTMLLLEIARVEFLNGEASSIEAENKRYEDLVAEYRRVVEPLEFSKLENRLLHRKVKKLARKSREQSLVIRDCNLKIEAMEGEISRNREELERRTAAINDLDNEVRDLQTNLNRVQEEKPELSDKLKLAENSAPSTSKIEADVIAMADYNQLVNQLEQLRKDRATEVKELVYLRWSNACLRHELVRNQKQEERNQENSQLEPDFDPNGGNGEHSLEHELEAADEPGLGVISSGQASKRPKMLEKLRRWVDGGEKIKARSDEKEKHESKCFGRHSISHKAEEHHLRRNHALVHNHEFADS